MLQKIAFMGTPNFAVPILKNIYQNGYEISAVYTQPPRKSNRGQKFEKSPIHSFAETISLDVLSLIHISEPTRPLYISYAVFCLKKKMKKWYLGSQGVSIVPLLR